ncbi:EpsG family protein [Vibrio rarus]|uniref:EpsG family protein n=1 Tax=Vibrio rarus TaxID=413403 RepID=UPI0036F38D91
MASIQYDIGRDYFSYSSIYNNYQYELGYYLGNHEYIFSGIVIMLNKLGLSSQYIFVTYSLLHSVLLFGYLSLVKNKYNKVSLALLFFVMFVITNFYHYQMSQLRQYVAIILSLYFVFFLVNGKILKALLFFCTAIFCHPSSFIMLIFIPLNYISKFKRKYTLVYFLASFILFGFIYVYWGTLSSLYTGTYAKYFQTSLNEGVGLKTTILKLVNIPVYIVFYYLYLKHGPICKFTQSNFFKFNVTAFSFLYMSIILVDIIGLYPRVYAYFIWFNIYPIYYVCKYFCLKRRWLEFVLVTCFISLPYLYKVIVYADDVYKYKTIMFN